MKTITSIMVLCTVATLWLPKPSEATEPTIVGTPVEVAADNAIRVKVGQPPWVNLSIKDAPADATQTWTGPIGEGKVAFYTKDGVGLATSLSGTFQFRCVIQTPKEGLDDILILESTVVVEGSGPSPTPAPTPVPVEDFATRLTNAVRAKQEAKLAQVAGTYETVANGIKSGLFTTPDQVTKATDGFVGLVGSTSWPEIKTNVVDKHLATLVLKTAADYEPLWRQIAAAIKAGLTDLPPPVVVDPPPIPVTSLHVLVVEEMDDRNTLPASQVGIFSSTALRKWFVENNVQWRMFDDDVDQSQLEQKWKAALARPRQSLPWLVASNGSKVFEGPLPKTESEVIALLEQYR